MNTLAPQSTTPTGPGTASRAADARRDEAPAPEPALLPAIDVVEDATGITLYADLPGVPKDKLNLRVEGEIALSVPEGMNAIHAEVQRSRYRRAFTLSKELDPDKVSAELAHGVLRVRIPKLEHAQPRRIEVQVG